MLKTNWREICFAFVGAFTGASIPLALHIWLVARFGEAELCGMPMAAFALPGLFVGAIIGARLNLSRNLR